MDHNLKNILKGTTSPSDVITHSPFSDMFTEIEAALIKEKPKNDAAKEDITIKGGSEPIDPDKVCVENLAHIEIIDENSDELHEWFAEAVANVWTCLG